ncbi:MAG: serine hydrolase domain-containing protein [Bacteroidota bacterium]
MILSYIKNLFGTAPKRIVLEGLDGLEKTNARFHNLVVENQVPGIAVTILKNGKTLLQKSYGYANLNDRVPIDVERTIFRIASISKCITGLALGKMVEEGIVDFDACFHDYVPYYPKKLHHFTLRQLASHTAGIRGYRGKEYALNRPYSIKESIAVFQDEPLVFEPGKGYLYSSFDFVLLSLAMQEASGIPFETYAKEKVLLPLGMENTFSPSLSGMPFRTQRKIPKAEFYSKTAMGFKNAVQVNNFYKLAGGGYLSTSADIAAMGQAILRQRLLKKETYDQLLTSQIVAGKPTYYGLGFQVSQDAQRRSFVGHVGNSVGAYTNFYIYPEEKTVVSVLINCTDPKVQIDLDKAFSDLMSTL